MVLSRAKLSVGEYGILRAVALDGYNDAEEAHRFLQAENIDIAYEAVEKQLALYVLGG